MPWPKFECLPKGRGIFHQGGGSLARFHPANVSMCHFITGQGQFASERSHKCVGAILSLDRGSLPQKGLTSVWGYFVTAWGQFAMESSRNVGGNSHCTGPVCLRKQHMCVCVWGGGILTLDGGSLSLVRLTYQHKMGGKP